MILKSKFYGNLQLWNWRQRSKSRCERIHRGNPLQPNFDSSKTVRITRQLTSNRALQKALENPEVKNAIMDVIESSIEEILANQKKVEL